jgi:hypothetical protein
MIQAYSCRPTGAEWHIVVFTATAKRARLLGFYAGPSGEDDDYIHWRARRLSAADGLCLNEKAWICAEDAPEQLRLKAAELWGGKC